MERRNKERLQNKNRNSYKGLIPKNIGFDFDPICYTPPQAGE